MRKLIFFIPYLLIQITVAQSKEDSLYTFIKSYDYTGIDKKVCLMEIGKTIKEHSEMLSNLCNNDQEKVRAAYIWVSTFITYSFSYTNYNSLDIALKTRKGVCHHFASIFNEICNNMNIESFYITGYIKRINGKVELHAWNVVVIQNQNFLLDPTWGIQFPEKYFLANPKEMILTHYPYNEKYQCLQEVITFEYFKSPGKYLHKYKKSPRIIPLYSMLK
jgi:hypothetical protein